MLLHVFLKFRNFNSQDSHKGQTASAC